MKRGRRSKYKPEYTERAFDFCSICGADDKQLARLFKTTKTTIENWKRQHPEFLDSVKRGKDVYDSTHVEKALLQRALGYDYDEVHYERIEEKPPEDILLKGETKAPDVLGTRVKTIKKRVAPDVTAQIFWLKNRHSPRWRDKQEHILQNPDGSPLDITVTFVRPEPHKS